MAGRLVIARHGRPNVNRDVRITAKEYGPWWAGYDAAGLAPGEAPPAQLLDHAEAADLILSSTLPRAIETAAAVAKGRNVPQEAVFVEAPLPPPPLPLVKLRPGTWGVISRTFWFCGYAPPGVENHGGSWRRAHEGVDLLENLAKTSDVLLCAHGYFNWMMGRVLLKRGWKRLHDGGNHYWAWREYKWPDETNDK